MLAIAATLASCSNDNDATKGGDDEMGTVQITILDGGRLAGRAEGTELANGAAITFNSGKMYFYATTGTITKVVDMVTAPGPGQISTAAGLKNITDVPSNSSSVLIVGNVPATLTLPTAGNINGVKTLLTTIHDQHPAVVDGSATNVGLYGEATLAGTNPKTAAITVAPIAARVEIHKFTQTGAVLTAYRIDGLFLTNYYGKLTLAGTKSTQAAGGIYDANWVVKNHVDNANPPAVYTSGTTEYNLTGDQNKTYDYAAAGLGTYTPASKVYAPTTAGNVWAYNVPTVAAGADNMFPHIVIRIGGITPTGIVSDDNLQYITVTGFKDAITGTPIASFEPGKIYKIKDFSFDHTDLDDIPQVTKVNANVTVTLATWSEVNVNPIH